jgi:glutamine amidotransferase
MSKILIVDYGMGNLRSVQKGFERVGYAAEISADPDMIRKSDKLILPGVGAFRDAIARVRETHLDQPIIDHIRKGRPFLGICLGLQLLFTRSFEDGVYEGLNILPGEIVRFPDIKGLKVPHMGWNHLRFRQKLPLFDRLPEESAVYFVHSYYAVPANPEIVAAESDYPTPFAAAVAFENIVATQFHPEKSQKVGLTMLENFARL